jgi:peptidyl-tRNA hydrolase
LEKEMPIAQQDPTLLYLIVRQSLENNHNKICSQIGDAVQHILIHYFKAQLLKVKLKDEPLPKVEEAHIIGMINWFSNNSSKIIKKANEEDWHFIKKNTPDILIIKDIEANETIIALWPQKTSQIPEIISKLIPY